MTMDLRLVKLGALLESRNRTLRAEAITALSQQCNSLSSTTSSQQILSIIGHYSRSQVWEGRVAAAELLATLLEDAQKRFQKELMRINQKINGDKMEECVRKISGLDLKEVLNRYRILVSSEPENSESANSSENSITTSQQRQQRQLIDHHLEMNSATGVTSQSFITDDELSNSNLSNQSSLLASAENGKMVLKYELETSVSGSEDSLPPSPSINKEESENGEKLLEEQRMQLELFRLFHSYLFRELISHNLLVNLAHPKWHIRHGAALALSKVCARAQHWLLHSPSLLARVSVCLLQLLTLDRFNDFVSGSYAVAPVREAAAQALSALMLTLGRGELLSKGENGVDKLGDGYRDHQIESAILMQLCGLLRMNDKAYWHCRQTVLLVAKYHFAVSLFALPAEKTLFWEALGIMTGDSVDECISAASQALCSLFANPRLDEKAVKSSLIGKVMEGVWVLLANVDRMAQFREGVDSVLVDLLSLVEFWLRQDQSAQLDAQQFLSVVELLDCAAHQPIRANRTLECICAAMDRANSTSAEVEWMGQHLFALCKQLYRCVLFTSPSSAPLILPKCYLALIGLLRFVGRQTGPTLDYFLDSVERSIGLWICCLIYEHRIPEIDVFLHLVDGPSTSRANSPREILCSSEINFLTAEKIDETLMERKVQAARFLAPLVDFLFHSGRTVGPNQQPISVSIQLLFLPYLRSNSLYQKLGASLVVHAWAVYQFELQIARNNCPALIANELTQLLNASSKLYDEVSHLVNVLTKECNDFQQYCIKKGVSKEELLPVNQANSVEDVVRAAYQSCEQRLRRQDDKQTLAARHNVVLDLCANTRLAIRTYTNRISALISSALFHFSNSVALPAQLTPLIKPLIESLDSETAIPIADLLFAPTFSTLLIVTSQREPRPHVKVLRQLCMGLGQCDTFSPKLSHWSNSEHRNCILSIERLESDDREQQQSTKSRNCALALRRICLFFGDLLEEKCAEFVDGQCCSLDLLASEQQGNGKELESLLLQLDSLRTVFPCLTSAQLRTKILQERVRPHIDKLFSLLAHQNPAVRFRVSKFIAELAALELCSVLKITFSLHSRIISDPNSSESARCGAAELLAQLTAQGGDRLLGAVSLLTPLALRSIGDQLESVRQAAAFAFRQLITFLPLENRSVHFLRDLAESEDEHLSSTYLSSFSLADVLTSPGNLPKLRQEEIRWLRSDVQLRGYQLEGITWMSFLHRFGLNGILADDMGLGKTLQVLCLVAWDHQEKLNIGRNNPLASSLIVCPRTLVDHWCNEWRNFFPSAPFRALKLPEWLARAKQTKQQNGNGEMEAAILVASYEELRGNRQILAGEGRRWNYAILDEGHCIRNPQSQMFDACCSIPAAHRLILSGTPVQNSPADLWALFHFLMPGYLSSRANFQSKFMRHILACRNPRATEQQCKEGEQALQLLHRQCLPFVMRRLKSEVLAELPAKIVQDQCCELSPLQKELYALVVDNCALGKKGVGMDATNVLNPLQALHALRKLVDHPALIADTVLSWARPDTVKSLKEETKRASLEHSGKLIALRELLVQCQIGDRSPTAAAASSITERRNSMQGTSTPNREENAPCPTMTAPTSQPSSSSFSAPLHTPSTCVPFGLPAHRALIFCQWIATIELVASLLDQGAFGPDISYLRLDGSVPADERQFVVERFNADLSIDLLLLTTQIGGVGLNLTGADVVIFVDHDWNPFRDLQAIDRAHRLGQTRTVNVYRLITRGTIEEKIMRLQRFKSDTANALVGADNRSLASMATDELLELFSLDVCSDQPKVKKAKVEVEGPQWALDDLWSGGEGAGDELEQYSQLHSVSTFLHSSNVAVSR